MNIIGIDPGKDGAIAFIRRGHETALYPLKNKSEHDIKTLLYSLTINPCQAYLEQVRSRPGQGVKSMFTFGMGYGFLRGVLVCAGAPIIDVIPGRWQKALGLGRKYPSKHERKRAHKALAEQWSPGRTDITLATADALLIAEYGYRTFYGQ